MALLLMSSFGTPPYMLCSRSVHFGCRLVRGSVNFEFPPPFPLKKVIPSLLLSFLLLATLRNSMFPPIFLFSPFDLGPFVQLSWRERWNFSVSFLVTLVPRCPKVTRQMHHPKCVRLSWDPEVDAVYVLRCACFVGLCPPFWVTDPATGQDKVLVP